MDLSNALLAYMAPQPSLPVASTLTALAGVALVLFRGAPVLFARWSRLAESRRARGR